MACYHDIASRGCAAGLAFGKQHDPLGLYVSDEEATSFQPSRLTESLPSLFEPFWLKKVSSYTVLGRIDL